MSNNITVIKYPDTRLYIHTSYECKECFNDNEKEKHGIIRYHVSEVRVRSMKNIKRIYHVSCSNGKCKYHTEETIIIASEFKDMIKKLYIQKILI